MRRFMLVLMSIIAILFASCDMWGAIESEKETSQPAAYALNDLVTEDGLMKAATDDAYYYSLLNVPASRGLIPGATLLWGDVNGDGLVDIIDALIIARFSEGYAIGTQFHAGSADVSGDGIIDKTDALLIAQYYVGLIETFPCENEPVQPSPQAFANYEFEGNAKDQSLNGLDGVVDGALFGENGYKGMAAFFDGTNKAIRIDSSVLFSVKRFAIAAWLKNECGTRTCAYLRMPGLLHLRNSGGKWDMVIEAGGSQTIPTGHVFEQGLWHHYIVGIDNEALEARFYVDGVQYGEAHQLSRPMSGSLIDADGFTAFKAIIGQYSSNYAWAGGIDELEFHEGPMSAEKAMAIYGGSGLGDVVAPTIPGTPRLVERTESEIGIEWDSSSDDTGMAGYIVYRREFGAGADFDPKVSTKNSYWSDLAIDTKTVYEYRVQAVDTSGNASSLSGSLVVPVPGVPVVTAIRFTTEGAEFSPVLTLFEGESASVEWTWADGTTGNSLAPVVDFGSEGNRICELRVMPWTALRRINIGYTGQDGGDNYCNGKKIVMEKVDPQRVSSVEGLENVRETLVEWCSSYSDIHSLNFNGFSALDQIECYNSSKLVSFSVRGAVELKRLCIEGCAITDLDLSECSKLVDLRGSSNDFASLIFGEQYDELYHICIRNNPRLPNNLANLSRYPILRDLFISGCNQSGQLSIQSNTLRSFWGYDNSYTSAEFSGNAYIILLMDRNSLESIDVGACPNLVNLQAKDNDLESIDLTGLTKLQRLNLTHNRIRSIKIEDIPSICQLELQGNKLDEAEIEGIVFNLIEHGLAVGDYITERDEITEGELKLDILGNAPLTAAALEQVQILKERGWIVLYE